MTRSPACSQTCDGALRRTRTCWTTSLHSCKLVRRKSEEAALADDLQLQIPDVDAFIDSLNMAGEILKSGRLWKAA